MAKGLQLYVLGRLEILIDEEPLTAELISLKGQALLIYLAVTNRPHPRTALAGLLWGELPERNARANLRYTLTKLRKYLPRSTLQTTRHNITLGNAWLDSVAFEQRLKTLTVQESTWLPYRGDFLEGFYLPNAPEFETWALGVRERLRQTAVSLIYQHVETAWRNQNAKIGIGAARQLLTIDPWLEEAHRYLMRFLATDGQRSAAIAQYNICRQILEEELDVAPSSETTELYQQILEDRIKPWPPAPKQTGSLLPEAPDEEPIVCVAREKEIDQLVTWINQVQAGLGQVCFVTGEAGAGKTTLVHELLRRLQKLQPHILIVGGQNNALTGISDPYTPFREAIAQLIGTAETQLFRLSVQQRDTLFQARPLTRNALFTMGPDLIGSFVNPAALENQQHPFFHEGSVRQSDSAPPGGLAQERLIGQITAVLKTIAAQQPLILILEDLQWIDTASTNLLFHLCRQIRYTPMGIIATYRAEEIQPEFGDNGQALTALFGEIKRFYGNVWLDLAERGDGAAFVNAYLDTQPNQYSDIFRRKLVQLTRGHALFTVELLREMQARGDLTVDEKGRWRDGDTIDWQTVPSRIEGAIESRLRRLVPSQLALLRLGSIEGETITAELLAHISGTPIREIISIFSQQLDKQHKLTSLDAVVWRDDQRMTRYRFRHNLFRQYLYDGLDEAQRSFWHDAVGLALESLFAHPDLPEVATQLAYHFQKAGNFEKAVHYRLLVGQQAGRLSAAREAIVHLKEGLQLLARLPVTPTRVAQALDYQIALGNALIIAEGYTSPEAGLAYQQAQELCQQLDNPPQIFPVLYGSWVYHHVRAEHKSATDIGQAWLTLATNADDTAALLMAHRVLGVSLLHMGKIVGAKEHLEHCIALYEFEKHRDLGLQYGQDPCVAGLMLLAWADWMSGQHDKAAGHVTYAHQLVTQLNHPFSRAFMLIHEAILGWLSDDWQTMHRCAKTAVQLCRHHGFPFWLAVGQILQSWSPGGENPTLGITDLMGFVSNYQQMGAGLWRPVFLAILAQAYAETGQTSVAQRFLDQAYEHSEQSGEMIWINALQAIPITGESPR